MEDEWNSFNQRKKLAKKYYEWLNSRNGLVDCPENVMAFLDAEGYFRNNPVKEEE